MVIKPLDDRTRCAQCVVADLESLRSGYVGVGDGRILQLAHRFLLAPYLYIRSIAYRCIFEGGLFDPQFGGLEWEWVGNGPIQ